MRDRWKHESSLPSASRHFGPAERRHPAACVDETPERGQGCLIFGLLCVASISKVVGAEPDAGTSAKPQVILLKLDDVVAFNRKPGPVSARWQRVTARHGTATPWMPSD